MAEELSLDSIGDSITADFPGGIDESGMSDAGSTGSERKAEQPAAPSPDVQEPPNAMETSEVAEADQEQQEAVAAAAEQVQFDSWRLRGRVIDPSHFKTNDDWLAFQDLVNQEIEAAGMRQDRFTQKTQEIAQYRKAYEQAVGQYNQFLGALKGPQGLQVMLALAKENNWEGADRILQQLKHNPNAPMMQEVSSLRNQIQEMQQSQEVKSQSAQLDNEWAHVSRQIPELTAHPSFKQMWLSKMLYQEMDPAAAASSVVEDLTGVINWEVIEKMPSILKGIEPAFKKRYLSEKTQSSATPPGSGTGGGGTASVPKQGKPKRALGKMSMEDYLDLQSEEMAGMLISDG